MFRLARFNKRTLTPLVARPTVSVWKYSRPSLFTNRLYSTENKDNETIDPKQYPELYPDEKEEEVDTEWFVDEEYQASEKDFIPLWQRQAIGEHLEDRLALQKVSQELMESGVLTAESVKDLLVESKLEDVEILDVREKCDWADYMVIASSSKGEKYLSSVADHVGTVVKKALEKKPYVEGKQDNSGWVLIDLGRIVVHLFTPEIRQHYDLEGLWNQVPNQLDAE